ncbi:50S ribosomal protein L23 [Candidatus Pacearchaeota archaeon]|jgi:large subunit ribosomal protein L23|nr:50S ribosomal protein L23 [Candidatus Pacearchaeota archaeon]|tara:strand:+ start:7530 stop:7772 length:243 start_codon:yes stop_codon:yes gene_type:complete
MIKKPITTEKAIRMIEIDNVLLFEVDGKDTKEKIKKNVEELFKVKVVKVNALHRKNKKFAYVTLDKKNPAIDVATKLGMI